MSVIHSTEHGLCKQDAVRPMPRIYGAQAISLKNVSMTEAVSRLCPHTDANWARLRALMNIGIDTTVVKALGRTLLDIIYVLAEGVYGPAFAGLCFVAGWDETLKRAFGFPDEKLAYCVEVSVGKEITGACVGLSADSKRDDMDVESGVSYDLVPGWDVSCQGLRLGRKL